MLVLIVVKLVFIGLKLFNSLINLWWSVSKCFTHFGNKIYRSQRSFFNLLASVLLRWWLFGRVSVLLNYLRSVLTKHNSRTTLHGLQIRNSRIIVRVRVGCFTIQICFLTYEFLFIWFYSILFYVNLTNCWHLFVLI